MATCADCKYMNLYDERNGKYWCTERDTYYPGGDSPCGRFDDGNKGCGMHCSNASCGDCARLNYGDERDGEYWCSTRPGYHDEGESSCSDFINKHGW